MRSALLTFVIIVTTGTSVFGQTTIKQLNTSLDEDRGNQWTYDSLFNRIRILEANAAQTYVFRATTGSDPGNDPLAEINTVDTDISSGTIRLMIAGDVNGTSAGATAVKKIAIDPTGVTSIIEGINITGDFLATEAMTVDSVTGDMLFGERTELSPAGLLNGITINGDLDGLLTVNGETDGAIHIQGAVNQEVVLMGHVNAPITIDGDIEDEIHIGKSNAFINVDGGMAAADIHYRSARPRLSQLDLL